METPDLRPTHADAPNTRAVGRISNLAALLGRDLGAALLGLLLLLLVLLLETWLVWLAPVRLVLGFIYLLYIPGYCLHVALFPRHDDLDGLERFGLSLSLSVAVLPILALILNILPSGLSFPALVLGHAVLTVLLVGGGIWQRARLPYATRYAPVLAPRPRQWWQQRTRTEQQTYRVLGAGSVIILLLIGATFATPPAPASTELYMLGAEGQATAYPRFVQVGVDQTTPIGIANHTDQPQHYRLEVWATWAWQPEAWWTQLAVQEGITLAAGEQRLIPITWRATWDADDVQVYFRLYPADAPADAPPHRELLLWLDVLPE